jgi:hypothetical protein
MHEMFASEHDDVEEKLKLANNSDLRGFITSMFDSYNLLIVERCIKLLALFCRHGNSLDSISIDRRLITPILEWFAREMYQLGLLKYVLHFADSDWPSIKEASDKLCVQLIAFGGNPIYDSQTIHRARLNWYKPGSEIQTEIKLVLDNDPWHAISSTWSNR